ncbi:DUF2500 domain-containing protein [Lysinibacillus capsici]|uniref:DUF2500 domain-containing protein n=1 Tax=Lysinibacillus capsici TaxID=2115968 RepID=UPI00248150E9|nr:DUF2500 domain-containing protein [Lysinibacillus capsici]
MFWFDNDFLFGSAFITIIFFIVFGSIAFMIVNGIITWSKNNRSPILTVPAKVVTKRTNIRGGSNNTGASTSELKMNGYDYGQLAEGDLGILTYQGTRYHSFNRHKKGE